MTSHTVVELPVAGMTCGHCVRSVQAALEAVPGVVARPAAVPIQEFPIPTYDATLIPKPQPSDDRTGLDEFPMNGIPHHEVVELVTRHHGVVVHSEEDRRAGDEWKSYRYFVRRDA